MEYALEFCSLAAENGWNKPMLKMVFCQGLNADMLMELAHHDDKATLDSLIKLAIWIDNLCHYRCCWSSTSVSPGNSISEPMQLGNTTVDAMIIS